MYMNEHLEHIETRTYVHERTFAACRNQNIKEALKSNFKTLVLLQKAYFYGLDYKLIYQKI